MTKEEIIQRVLHLFTVERFNKRQIALQLNIDRGRVLRIIRQAGEPPIVPIKKNNLDQFMSLIGQWYQQYPKLNAWQIYERLKVRGYLGGYTSVKLATMEYRKVVKTAYHPLIFNPGQEAQVDWFFFKHEQLGKVAGFLYVLSYSRYAWGVFYQRSSMEFFLSGHQECFKHIGGLVHEHRYDNLKSVVTRRDADDINYNAQFMDFARFYGFSPRVCNPYSGNEKGRVERIIRDIRRFLATETFADLIDLNRKFHAWLERRNNTVHRSTNKTPKTMLTEERLLKAPVKDYDVKRIMPVRISKTALIEFETNRYSVPTSCVGKMAELIVYTTRIELWLYAQKIATHKRCFDRMQMIQNPLHAEVLLNRSPKFRLQRVLQVIRQMDTAFKFFLERCEDGDEQIMAADQIYQLMRRHSRAVVLSAVRELNSMNNFKISALMSILRLPGVQEPPAVWPKDSRLLNLNYEERNLKDYDPDTRNL
jgi:transposase